MSACDFIVSNFNGRRQYSVQADSAKPAGRKRAHPSLKGGAIYAGLETLDVEIARFEIPSYLHGLTIDQLADMYERNGKL